MSKAGDCGNILVADDEAVVRELIAEILVGSGYRVCGVADGEEALRTFEASPGRFDLVILDVLMPNKSGLEVYGILKAQAPGVPVMLTSGYHPENLGTGLGSHDSPVFLLKPFTPATLLSKVREALEAATHEVTGERSHEDIDRRRRFDGA